MVYCFLTHVVYNLRSSQTTRFAEQQAVLLLTTDESNTQQPTENTQ